MTVRRLSVGLVMWATMLTALSCGADIAHPVARIVDPTGSYRLVRTGGVTVGPCDSACMVGGSLVLRPDARFLMIDSGRAMRPISSPPALLIVTHDSGTWVADRDTVTLHFETQAGLLYPYTNEAAVSDTTLRMFAPVASAVRTYVRR